jgi:hypothetical protein
VLPTPPPELRALMLVSGVFWTIAYVLILVRAERDRRYGMPMLALAANLSWELTFAVVTPHSGPQMIVNGVWLLLDVGLAVQFLRFAHVDFPTLSRTMTRLLFAVAVVTAFGIVSLSVLEFDDRLGAYSAFGMNLLMSISFLFMLFRRRSLAGQSVAIALTKLLGTLFASIADFIFRYVVLGLHARERVLPLFLYLAIFFFDVVYLVVLLREKRRPWLTAVQPQPASTT